MTNMEKNFKKSDCKNDFFEKKRYLKILTFERHIQMELLLQIRNQRRVYTRETYTGFSLAI